jgi:hypothetical protein
VKLSEKVKHVMNRENISEQELFSMIHLSSPLKDKKGNRRFHEWAFYTVDDNIIDMFHLERPKYRGTGQKPVYKPCEVCGGKGCKDCHYHGYILYLE